MTQTLTLEDGRQIDIEWNRVKDTRQIYGTVTQNANMFKVKEALKCQVDGIHNAFVGWAFMSRNEPVYDAARARRLSLERAIEYVSKPDRTLVWQAYNRANPPAKTRHAARRPDRALRLWLDTLAKGQAL